VPDATHEAVTYFFAELVPPVLTWLSGASGQGNSIDSHAGADTPISSQ